tara:strand:- start:142 stop:549 length:408 start_codon:yes stop_codon:yes gene_type:complete
MSKKIKEEWISFHEDGQRWMICKSCQSDYVKCSENVAAVTCSRCVLRIDMIKFPGTIKKQKVSSGKPAGWHFMSEYVDKDGNVFYKGKEQTDLKGTLKPTKVKPRKKKKKLTEEEKLARDLKNWKKRLKAKRGNK